jgi:hypothetical protein
LNFGEDFLLDNLGKRIFLIHAYDEESNEISREVVVNCDCDDNSD